MNLSVREVLWRIHIYVCVNVLIHGTTHVTRMYTCLHICTSCIQLCMHARAFFFICHHIPIYTHAFEPVRNYVCACTHINKTSTPPEREPVLRLQQNLPVYVQDMRQIPALALGLYKCCSHGIRRCCQENQGPRRQASATHGRKWQPSPRKCDISKIFYKVMLECAGSVVLLAPENER